MIGGKFLDFRFRRAVLVIGLALVVTAAAGQESRTAPAAPVRRGSPNTTPAEREAATHQFLGLGVVPDKDAAAKGAPLFQQSCSFCHGVQARGAEGPNLVTSDVVLGDDHGERLIPFLKKGRPDKGMPSFASVPDEQLRQIAEFLHLQVEDVVNRGTYHVLNILVGDAGKGQAYVAANCMSCHAASAFAHIADRFRTPDQLQRGWIWPNRPADHSLDITATVKAADGSTESGRVTQISDFRITLVDATGQSKTIARGPGTDIEMRDPLAPHQAMLMTLKNDDMHNVTAYLETLK